MCAYLRCMWPRMLGAFGCRCGRMKARTDRSSPGMLERLSPAASRPFITHRRPVGGRRRSFTTSPIAALIPPPATDSHATPVARCFAPINEGDAGGRAMSARIWRPRSRLCHAGGARSRSDQCADDPKEREEESEPEHPKVPFAKRCQPEINPACHVDNGQHNPEKGHPLHHLRGKHQGVTDPPCLV